MYPSKTPTSHVAVCTVLDELADGANRTVNWRKPVYAAIDELRAMAAPADRIDTAERISIVLLKLEWAMQKEDREKQQELREQLAALADSWRELSGPAPLADDGVMEPHEVGSVTEALERINRRHY